MLTPLDIENKVFKKSTFGYDKADVEEFLSVVLDSYEKSYKENIVLRDRMNVLTDGIQQYKNMEDSLQSALVIAQSTGEEVKKSAREKAENILKEVEIRSFEMISSAKSEVNNINAKFNEVRRELEQYKFQMISLLNYQIGILNDTKALETNLPHNVTSDEDISNSYNKAKKASAMIFHLPEDGDDTELNDEQSENEVDAKKEET